MTKTFSKLLAVVLSLCVLLAIPVCAAAEDEYFQLNGSTFKAVTGDWNADYIGRLKITVAGGVNSVAAEENLIKVTINDIAEPVKIVKISEADVVIKNGTAEITFPLERYMNHADTYNFTIPEGTFKSADGKLNAEYTISASGNELIETSDVSEVPVTPVQKIVQWLTGYLNDETIGWLVKIVIDVLNWFMNI